MFKVFVLLYYYGFLFLPTREFFSLMRFPPLTDQKRGVEERKAQETSLVPLWSSSVFSRPGQVQKLTFLHIEGCFYSFRDSLHCWDHPAEVLWDWLVHLYFRWLLDSSLDPLHQTIPDSFLSGFTFLSSSCTHIPTNSENTDQFQQPSLIYFSIKPAGNPMSCSLDF